MSIKLLNSLVPTPLAGGGGEGPTVLAKGRFYATGVDSASCYNIESISQVSTGDFLFTFTEALLTDKYAVFFGFGTTAYLTGAWITRSTANVELTVRASGTLYDPSSYVDFVVIG